MKLQYHQATFDMLTKSPIDPQPYLDTWAEYEAALEYPQPPERFTWMTMPLYQRPIQISEENVRLLDAFEN